VRPTVNGPLTAFLSGPVTNRPLEGIINEGDRVVGVQTVRKSRDGKHIMVARNGVFHVSKRDARGDWQRVLSNATLRDANAYMDRV
jgi:hypothetical protein